MWLISNIIMDIEIILDSEMVKKGTVLERFIYVKIFSKILFLLLIVLAMIYKYRVFVISFTVSFSWLLHAYINSGEIIIEPIYIIVPTLGSLMFFLKHHLTSKVGLPTRSV